MVMLIQKRRAGGRARSNPHCGLVGIGHRGQVRLRGHFLRTARVARWSRLAVARSGGPSRAARFCRTRKHRRGRRHRRQHLCAVLHPVADLPSREEFRAAPRLRTSGANRSDDHFPSQWNDCDRHAAPVAGEFRGSRRDLSAVAASDAAPNGRPRSEGQVHTVTFPLANRDVDANALRSTMYLAVLLEKRPEKVRFRSC